LCNTLLVHFAVRIIGVVDLLAGRAVHARAGQRETYRPVTSVAGTAIESGDALALARSYVARLGLTELYAADLDAIMGGASQDTLVAALAAVGVPLWLDAGVSSVDRARHALALGAARVVVGLETLPSYAALGEICAAVGGDNVAFSLDLRDGDPVVASGGIPPGEPAHLVAARARDAGAGAVIVIDLARVGTGRGLDLELIARVREAAPEPILLAGGGVRGLDDLTRLADAGCDGALVATALHDGRIGTGEIADARRHPSFSR
jgi:phosphoribosylformimino-5-aminoimidazole carboxamide ribotide isomerase